MRTVTLGQYRFRERQGKVYVYIFDNGHEKYIGPLEKMITTWEQSTIDCHRQNEGDSNVKEERSQSSFTTDDATTPSGIAESELAHFFNFCLQNASEQTCRLYRAYLKKPPNGASNSVKAWRMYYKWKGKPEERKKLKIPKSGSDLRYVTEEEIVNAIKKADERTRYILLLLVESGARLSELIKVLNEYDPKNDVKQGNESTSYILYTINWQRGKKRSFYLFHVSPLEKMSISYRAEEKRLKRYIEPKMIRKFVATTMFQRGIPTEIIDFIQGRSPSTVATKHYIYLLSSAKKAYQEVWIPYLQKLLI